MSNSEKIQKLANLTNTSKLDGKSGLSEAERLAVAYAIDQFELDGNDVNIESLSPQTELLQEINEKINDFYKVLSGKTPHQQTVYIDLSELEGFYKSNFEKQTSQSFEQFKKDYLSSLEEYFKLPGGRKLNLLFTTSKPKEGKYITLVVSPQTLVDFIKSDSARRVKVVETTLFLSARDPKLHTLVEGIIERVKGKHSPTLSKEELYIKVFEEEDFQKFYRGPQQLARSFSEKGTDFGNLQPHELIYISAGYLLGEYNFSLGVLQGRQSLSSPTYLNPWIAQNNGKGLAKAFADTSAHEIGHALGLNHCGQINIFKRNRNMNTRKVETPYLMCQPQQLQFSGFNITQTYFNDFAKDYLKFILGTKK